MKRTTIRCLLLTLLCGLFLCGCTGPKIIEFTKGPLTAKQKQCLSKAYRYDKNGWIFLHIEGSAFERGFQRGYLTAGEIDDFYKTISYMEEFETAKEMEFFEKSAARLFKNKVSKEYTQELRGLVAGMQKAGFDVTYDQMLLMNGFIDIFWYWWPQSKEKERFYGPGCSAFIATGDLTTNGQIVMAHNSWSRYAMLQFCNIIVEIFPDKGHKIPLQSWGPFIYSATDVFITSAGIIGLETTIGGFKGFNPKGTPVFERARRAMQYADTIDQWAQIMKENNSGAYANSWLIGDIRTNQIARLELGLKHSSLEKKNNGYFSGSNVTDNIDILRTETNATYDDIRKVTVARRERFKQLMKQHRGKIDIDLAREIIADHYDMYLRKDQPSSRTICGHYELDDGSVPGGRIAYYPGGAIDAKVVDSATAKNWQILARWGSSCDIGFDAKKFLREHTQFDWQKGYLRDLPAQPWTVFPEPKKVKSAIAP